MLSRYYGDLGKYLKSGHVLIIFGPRQAGKTTLLNHFLSKSGLKYKLDSGDNIRTQHLLGSQDFEKIIEYAEGYDLIAIDEAQQIPNIGKALKILVDQVANLKIIATGSSSFDLAQNVGEPLTGRKSTLTLYPIAQMELLKNFNKHELQEHLEDYLIFGSYPAVLTASTRDERINILNLVKLLAFQIGQLVSINELATQLHIDSKTVNRYLDLLEKSFVICKLGGFSRNLRNEITSKHKYYFLDPGIRNGVIAQFNPLENRNDVGQLWENFIFIERLKKLSYTNFYGNRYFWRTYEGQEIDFLEELENELSAFEVKWSEKKKQSSPSAWRDHYPNSSFVVINRDNYLNYIT
jgi:predicted AAA+ superfamily ATPase